MLVYIRMLYLIKAKCRIDLEGVEIEVCFIYLLGTTRHRSPTFTISWEMPWIEEQKITKVLEFYIPLFPILIPYYHSRKRTRAHARANKYSFQE